MAINYLPGSHMERVCA